MATAAGTARYRTMAAWMVLPAAPERRRREPQKPGTAHAQKAARERRFSRRRPEDRSESHRQRTYTEQVADSNRNKP